MKRLLSLLLCVSLSLFLVACGGNNYGNGMKRSPAAKGKMNAPLNGLADGVDPTPINEQVEALINEYVGSGQYTKLTTLKYNSDSSNYHAGANTAQRRTYYDETADALLMGNYDGTFSTINSGYAKVGSDMWHYSNKAETKTTSNLFAQEEMSHDYTVYATGPKTFFDVLSDLATGAHNENTSSRWNITNGVYTYTADVPATVYDSGNYTNGLLKMFQYFAAPMLLLNNNVGLQKVTLQERDAYVGETLTKVLFIVLFDSSDNEVSEAIVAKGLTFDSVLLVDANSVAAQKAKLQTIPAELNANVDLASYLLGDCNVAVSVTSDYLKYRYNQLVLNRAYGDTDQEVTITFTITCGETTDTYAHTATVKALTSEGDGSQANPKAVYNAAGYLAMTQNKYYIVTKDIDFTDVTCTGISANRSHIDGQMHVVSHYSLSYTAGNGGGMFLTLGTSFELRNIIFDTCSVTNTNSRTGLLIGMCNGNMTLTLDNIKVFNSTVSGTDYVGGVIGRIGSQGTEHYTINNIYADVTITSTAGNAGGLIGGITSFAQNADSYNISNIYTTGTITATNKNNAGGIIGFTSHTYSIKTDGVNYYYGYSVDGNVLNISNVVSTMDITANKNVAGILGFVESITTTAGDNPGEPVLGQKTIDNAVFYGTITANENVCNILARDNGYEKATGTDCYTSTDYSKNTPTGRIVGTVLTAEQLTSWAFYEALGFSSEYWTVGENGLMLK